MTNLEQQLESSAREGAAGSGNTIGANFLEKKGGKRNHQGNGRQAGIELKEEMDEIKKIKERINRDLARFEADKSTVNSEISLIRNHIKEAEAKGDMSAANNWGTRLSRAEDMLKVIEKTSPSIEPISDEEIRKELDMYRKARNRQGVAELRVNKNSSDKDSIGEYVRAQAEAAAISEKIEGLIKKRAEGNILAFSGEEESISYTHEQALADEKARAEKHLSSEAPVADGLDSEEGIIHVETKPSSQATANDWQEKAVATFENEGGKVLDADLEHTPEEHNASLPILTDTAETMVGETMESAEAKFETAQMHAEEASLWGPSGEALAVVKTLAETTKTESPNTTAEKRIESSEEKKERILSAIYKKHNVDLPERARKAGMSETMLDIMRAGGGVYKEMPLKKKLLISLTLFGVAYTAGGTIASIAIGGSLFQRALGGLATFIGAEGLMKASAEKGGRKRGDWEARRQTGIALVAGFLVGGGVLGHAIQNVLSEAIPSHEKPVSHPSSLEPAPTPATEVIGVAEAGDSRWSLIEKALEKGPYADKFSILNEDQKTYVIDSIKDKLTEGMTKEAADSLNVGDTIDFKEIFADKNFMASAFDEAHELTKAEIANIHSYAGEPETPSDEPTLLKTFDAPNEAAASTAVNAVHLNGLIDAGIVKGNFHYSANGTVEGITTQGTVSMTEAHKLLNSNWQALVRGHATAGGAALDIGIVDSNASTVFQYEQMLKSLEGKGAGASPEADFLRNSIERTVNDIEKTYGDVFKNIGDFNKPEPAITTSVIPQEILPTGPKDILMKDYVPQVSTDVLNNPQALIYAQERVHEIVKEVFGSSGFLGIGSSDGMEIFKEYSDKTVDEVLKADVSQIPGGNTAKVQDLINQARDTTHVKSLPGEKIMDYLNRATAINIDSYMKAHPLTHRELQNMPIFTP